MPKVVTNRQKKQLNETSSMHLSSIKESNFTASNKDLHHKLGDRTTQSKANLSMNTPLEKVDENKVKLKTKDALNTST